MPVAHLEILVEERSMEAFLSAFLPKVLESTITFRIHTFQGKHDLLKQLPNRLSGYQKWIPNDWCILVIVDRDDDDCTTLKNRIETIVQAVGLTTPRQAVNRKFNVVIRIAIEELEAWYFGDWEAVRAAYPGIRASSPYRDPDAVKGGTWQALERILQKAGYMRGGFQKVTAAKEIAPHFNPQRNRSHSFQVFYKTLQTIISDP